MTRPFRQRMAAHNRSHQAIVLGKCCNDGTNEQDVSI
jgi:hypothetical protein